MVKQFDEDGVFFQYPDNWTLTREDVDGGWTASLQSPATAFLVVTLDRTMPEPQQMADTALEALRSEYPTLEADAAVDMLAGEMAVGHDIHFFSFDLSNTGWTRGLYVRVRHAAGLLAGQRPGTAGDGAGAAGDLYVVEGRRVTPRRFNPHQPGAPEREEVQNLAGASGWYGSSDRLYPPQLILYTDRMMLGMVASPFGDDATMPRPLPVALAEMFTFSTSPALHSAMPWLTSTVVYFGSGTA